MGECHDHLDDAERATIMMMRADGEGIRAIARKLSRSPRALRLFQQPGSGLSKLKGEFDSGFALLSDRYNIGPLASGSREDAPN